MDTWHQLSRFSNWLFSGQILKHRAFRLSFAIMMPISVLLGIGLLLLTNPENNSGPMPCFFHQITGFYCIGCGTTRALRAILEGRLLTAFSYNAFMLLWLPLPAWMIFRLWVYTIWQCWLPAVHDHRWLMWLLLASSLVFLIARNIPLPFFRFLAP